MRQRLDKTLNRITDESPISDKYRRLISMIALILASLIALSSYNRSILGLTIPFSSTSPIRPDAISAIAAIALVVPLYARGILKWSFSIYGIISMFLFLFVYSAVVKLAISGPTGLPVYLFVAALLISWLGIRSVAGMAWVLAIGAAIINLISTNDLMGVYGFSFIALSFFGLLAHSGFAPAELVDGLVSEYSPASRKLADAISRDLPTSDTVGT